MFVYNIILLSAVIVGSQFFKGHFYQLIKENIQQKMSDSTIFCYNPTIHF